MRGITCNLNNPILGIHYLYGLILMFLLAVVFSSCQQSNESPASTLAEQIPKIFEKLPAETSGIFFANNLKEDSVINYFTYPYIYMGGGVAIGDINNDGLKDLFFTGNMVENKLYLNQGNLKFKDITSSAGVGGDDRWITGVTMADVNADGWLDIYVSVSGKFTTTKNLLYINNAEPEKPGFTESAEQYGLADEGRTTQGTFFDYDNDGDLDLYLANYPFTSFKTINYAYKFKMDKKDPQHSDKLYENTGDGKFKDVTAKAGLLNFGLSLSATVADFNKDGWQDIYVSNDFATPDYFYFNNGDGTFSEKVKETTQHTAYFGMGVDVADINNDGLLDILQMDMTPYDNRRNKANMASMNPAGFWEMVGLGMHHQYMQNVLQLNNGVASDSLPHFSDISRITGISSTDWSWAGLMADLDNDGNKDIFITNGTRRDINNKDFFKEIDKADSKKRKTFDYLELTKEIPSEKIDNFAYKNNGNLSFTNVIKEWGLSYEGFSNGAAYGDLDNDGDLDVVINNIDDQAVVFENKTTDLSLANYLRIQLNGSKLNPNGLDAKLMLTTGDNSQFHQHTLTRGFQSSVEEVVHFGIGQATNIDKLEITWPDGSIEVKENIEPNQLITLDYNDAGNIEKVVDTNNTMTPQFTDVTKAEGIDFQHKENPYNDFNYEVLLPHVYSRNGPALATGDVNGDKLDDFYVGGAVGQAGVLYLQHSEGGFRASQNTPFEDDYSKEDIGATFFDADGDKDLDLYVVSGGNEFVNGAKNLADRLYINNGDGKFIKDDLAIPTMTESGSRVKAADYDNDGDLDLFVGGRVVPRSYPLPAKSYILRNDSRPGSEVKFTDVTAQIAPDLMKAGLVTDAVWVDYDQDDQLDLIVVGEWMPITFLKNKDGKFENKTEEYGFEKSAGWWYSIVAEDFDKDGDMDLVAGNLGLNYKYQASPEASFDVYAYDYDKNGRLDIVLGYYNDGVQYPLRGRQCSSEQISNISIKYQDYNSFAEATLEDIYSSKDLEASLHYQAWNFASSYIENNGGGNFQIKNLPVEAQLSSINGIIAEDFNNDGHLDIAIAGNLYVAEVETTRNDASYGLIMKGDGQGNFKPIPYSESGFFLKHDTKALEKMNTADGIIILAANNNEDLKAMKLAK